MGLEWVERPTPEHSPRWHARYAACQGCGGTDRPHLARGMCEPCYRKARASRATVEESVQSVFTSISRAWHRDYPACVICGTTMRPHLANGYCIDCYRRRNALGDRGHESVPVYATAGSPAGDPGPAAVAAPATGPIPGAPPDRGPARPVETPDGTAADGAEARIESSEGGEPVAAPAFIEAPIPPPATPAPVLYSRHIAIVRTYRITCPNCGTLMANPRDGAALFEEADLPAGTVLPCGECGARWMVALERLLPPGG